MRPQIALKLATIVQVSYQMLCKCGLARAGRPLYNNKMRRETIRIVVVGVELRDFIDHLVEDLPKACRSQLVVDLLTCAAFKNHRVLVHI